jgi:hypothetical protein
VNQETCKHHYWPQIMDDGEANVWKCGRCGHIKPWSVGDYAEAYSEGDRLWKQHKIGWVGTSSTDLEGHDD